MRNVPRDRSHLSPLKEGHMQKSSLRKVLLAARELLSTPDSFCVGKMYHREGGEIVRRCLHGAVYDGCKQYGLDETGRVKFIDQALDTLQNAIKIWNEDVYRTPISSSCAVQVFSDWEGYHSVCRLLDEVIAAEPPDPEDTSEARAHP